MEDRTTRWNRVRKVYAGNEPAISETEFYNAYWSGLGVPTLYFRYLKITPGYTLKYSFYQDERRALSTRGKLARVVRRSA